MNRQYGTADLERGLPITTSTRFDVGSVQKQFTAASILLLAEEDRLSLSDDVRDHIPELPDYGHTITLDHLLTHTSGIRDWPGMLAMAADDPHVLTKPRARGRDLAFTPLSRLPTRALPPAPGRVQLPGSRAHARRALRGQGSAAASRTGHGPPPAP